MQHNCNAQYVETTLFIERPGRWPAGEGAALFVQDWATLGVYKPTLMPLVILDIHGVLTDDDKAFFRKQREERFGSRLEEVRRACKPCVAGTAIAWGRVIAWPDSAEVGW